MGIRIDSLPEGDNKGMMTVRYGQRESQRDWQIKFGLEGNRIEFALPYPLTSHTDEDGHPYLELDVNGTTLEFCLPEFVPQQEYYPDPLWEMQYSESLTEMESVEC